MLLATAMLGCLAFSGAATVSAQPNMMQPRQAMAPAEIANEISIDQKLGAQVPLNLEFTDESGRKRPLSSFIKEKPVILVLAYYRCPMLCGEVLNGLVRAIRPLKFDIGNEFDIVTVSIDPKETAALASEKKANYIEDYGRPGAEKGWSFLTGEQESIAALANTVGFRYVYEPQTKQYAHAGGLIVLTPEGKVSKYFYGVDYRTDDLRLGLVEASGNNIGSAVDKVLLLCYKYDPITGKYGLAITRTLQLGGIVTVGAIGGFIFFSMRRERRRKIKAAGAA
jgi:protein SCO1/2